MPNRLYRLIEAMIHPPDTSEESVYVRKILTEYRNRRPLYEEFRSAVHKMLNALLQDSNYKYQIVSRTKTPERLREKLIRKNTQDIRYSNLSDVEDLTGVRVLFYSESDKERFVKELKKEMNGGMMQVQDKKRESGYEATHIIMTLDKKRLELSEYKHFYNLKCEIQVTSILQHTWAEIEHDFIYKDVSGLKKRNPERFALVEKKLGEILEKHIKQASREFEEIIKLIDGA